MILMMQREIVDNHKWLTKDEFINYLSLAQAAPGPMAVNLSILIGYHKCRVVGGMAGFLGSVLPSFIILLTVAIFFKDIYNHPTTEKIFKGLRPAVVALILFPVFTFAKNVNRWEYPIFIAIGAAIYYGISPLYMILGGILGGLGLTYFKTRKKQ